MDKDESPYSPGEFHLYLSPSPSPTCSAIKCETSVEEESIEENKDEFPYRPGELHLYLSPSPNPTTSSAIEDREESIEENREPLDKRLNELITREELPLFMHEVVEEWKQELNCHEKTKCVNNNLKQLNFADGGKIIKNKSKGKEGKRFSRKWLQKMIDRIIREVRAKIKKDILDSIIDDCIDDWIIKFKSD